MKRREAIAQGLSHYSTGKPCRNGHLEKRLTINGGCLKCACDLSSYYRERFPEKQTAQSRNYRAANSEKVRKWGRDQSARRRAINPEKERQRIASWIEKNPERWRENRRIHSSKRRAAKMDAVGSFTAAEFAALCKRQGFRCFYCAEKHKLEADHYLPLSRGGSNGIGNIRAACRSCNARKHVKAPEIFARENGMLCY